MLANQKCVVAGGPQLKEIVMRAQAGFADRDTMFRDALDQLEGSFRANGQSSQITIVHANDAGVRGESAFQLHVRVHFDERLRRMRAQPRLPSASWCAIGRVPGRY